MWFIFPQLAGLGRSSMAERYAIASAAEAKAYLAHPVLGQRLVEATSAVNEHSDKTAEEIFGSVDAMKFRSSLTLFASVAEPDAPFRRSLDIFYGGIPDPV